MIIPKIQDKIIFPEILWQRPLNKYRTKGKVLVFSDEKNLSNVLKFCEEIYFTQIKKIQIAYSQKLSSTLSKIIPQELQLPLENNISSILKDFDILVYGFGKYFPQNIKEDFPVLFINSPYAQKNARNIYSLSSDQLAVWLKTTPNKIQENPMFYLSKLAPSLGSNTLIIKISHERIFVVRANEIIITKIMNFQKDDLLIEALTAAFWSQNLNQPFKSACTACFVANEFWKNYKQPKDIQKAIYKLESFDSAQDKEG